MHIIMMKNYDFYSHREKRQMQTERKEKSPIHDEKGRESEKMMNNE